MENRVPIVDETCEPFIIMSNDGISRVDIIEVIGSGGSCLVYRGKLREAGSEKTVIIKEYYPLDTYNGAYFSRDPKNKYLKINADRNEAIEYELNLKRANIERELSTNNRLYATPDQKSNTPYMYATWELVNIPEEYKKNSAYIVIDTSEGVTLKKALESQPHQRYGILEAIGYIKKMLVIIEYMSEKGCIHGDLSLENIYITGKDDNAQMRFLDFGSAFFIEDYAVDMNDVEAVKSMAEKIKNNLAICSSHDDIRPSLTRTLERCKQQYYINPTSIQNAMNLVQALHNIDIKCDLYAVVNNFYKLITGKAFSSLPSERELAGQYLLFENEYIQNDILTRMLHEMFSKNGELKYDTVESLRKDIEEIEKVAGGMVTPESLIRKLQMEVIEVDFDERLATEIEIFE